MAESKKTITEALLENAARGEGQRLTIEQLAAHLGVLPASVHEAASRLRRQGRLAPSARQVTGAALPLPQVNGSPARSPRGRRVMDAAERLELATYIAETAPAPVAVNALKLLGDQDPQPLRMLALPKPLTETEQVQRLGNLMLACGKAVTRRALAYARMEQEREQAPSEPPEGDPPPASIPREV